MELKLCQLPHETLKHQYPEQTLVRNCFSQVDPEYVEVDLGKAEQLTAHFLKVNPKHQVPFNS